MNYVWGMLAVLLPGLAWWAWFGHDERSPAAACAKVFCLSFSFVALTALILFMCNMGFGPTKVWIWRLIWPAIILVGIAANRKRIHFDLRWLITLLLVALAIVWRLWQARTLVLPNWVDSLHHSLIVRVFLENQRLTATLEPYLPGNFYYHFGFHTFTALFAGFTKLIPSTAVLQLGQVLNAMVSLSIFVLVEEITEDWKPALIAGLFSLLVTKMPGYYLTWGRYTLLVGIMLLALTMASTLRIIRGRSSRSELLVLFLLTAGNLLSHYFTAFLLAAWLVIVAVMQIAGMYRQKKPRWKPVFCLTIPVLLAFLACLVWYVRIWQYGGNRANMELGISSGGENLAADWAYLGNLIGMPLNFVLAGLAIIGLVWSVAKRKHRMVAIWSLGLAIMSLPVGLKLSSFRSDYFALLLFFPISIFAAISLYQSVEQVQLLVHEIRLKPIVVVVSTLVIGSILVLGAWQGRNPINPATVLADKDDLEALDWINTHLPADARFFINTTPWGFGLYRGVDGGAWITPYTGRWSIVPTNFGSMLNNNVLSKEPELTDRPCTKESLLLQMETTNAHYLYLTNISKQRIDELTAAQLYAVFQNNKVKILVLQTEI